MAIKDGKHSGDEGILSALPSFFVWGSSVSLHPLIKTFPACMDSILVILHY